MLTDHVNESRTAACRLLLTLLVSLSPLISLSLSSKITTETNLDEVLEAELLHSNLP